MLLGATAFAMLGITLFLAWWFFGDRSFRARMLVRGLCLGEDSALPEIRHRAASGMGAFCARRQVSAALPDRGLRLRCSQEEVSTAKAEYPASRRRSNVDQQLPARLRQAT